MQNQPLLTIGIPTYNRAQYLFRTLESIYNQIGDNDEVEVLIIDNHSPDFTEDIVGYFISKYHNITYVKNETNIGVNKNIFKVFETARGKYCLTHGDDDLFWPGTLDYIINGIKMYPDRVVYYIDNVSYNRQMEQGTGMDQFVSRVSYFSTHISSVIVNKSSYNMLEERDKFLDSYINHVYIMLSLIGKDQDFIIFAGYTYGCSGLTNVAYKYGEVFIKGYQAILNYFIPLGLSEEVIAQEKLRVLHYFIVPYYKERQNTPMSIEMYDTLEYFVKYYKDEPYFESYYEVLKEIQDGYSWK